MIPLPTMKTPAEIDSILISEKQIEATVRSLALKINSTYHSIPILVVGLLRGSFMFMADLVRHLDMDVELDFMTVSSYGAATTSSTEVKIIMDLGEAIAGRHVLIVEDIIDTGLTLAKVMEILKGRSPASLKICTLLNKPSRRKVNVEVDFVGIDIPDHFVCGYGLDFNQRFRNLPFIGILKK